MAAEQLDKNVELVGAGGGDAKQLDKNVELVQGAPDVPDDDDDASSAAAGMSSNPSVIREHCAISGARNARCT